MISNVVFEGFQTKQLAFWAWQGHLRRVLVTISPTGPPERKPFGRAFGVQSSFIKYPFGGVLVEISQR